MKLSLAASHTIAALIQLADLPAGDLLNCRQMCVGNDMPAMFLPQLLLKMKHAGAVDGRPGRYGGYRLAKPPRAITLLEIIEAIDGKLDQYGRSEVAGMAPSTATAIDQAFAAAVGDARKRLAAVTLGDLREAKSA